MRTFLLYRDIDVTGVSGTGVVAEGIEFSDHTVAMHWIAGEYHSTVIWDSIASVEAIHGHAGATRIVWTTTEDNPHTHPEVHSPNTSDDLDSD